ncbi:MAG: hypothetical protein ABW096_08910 [Candidatus Thiodiazotropha sp.]
MKLCDIDEYTAPWNSFEALSIIEQRFPDSDPPERLPASGRMRTAARPCRLTMGLLCGRSHF